MNPKTTQACIERLWEGEILPALHDYVRIPAQSPLFDPDWEQSGHIEAAVMLAHDFVQKRAFPGARLEVLRLPKRTPVLFLELPGTKQGTVLLYGHLDKQPPFDGWREGLGPWTPVVENGLLYGRGAADDGYAVFASCAALQALQEQGTAHPRIVALIECSEESGSPDLPLYMDAFAEKIGSPDLVIGLDSGCGDYERLWATTSLRGIVAGNLRVDVLREGVHSGDASGIVASSFRILRMVLDRLEDPQTGAILPAGLHVEIPAERLEQALSAASILGDGIETKFPFVAGMTPISTDPAELILNRTWRPALSITGASGLPPVERAGNVLRPYTTAKLSLRIPPTLDSTEATAALKAVLERDPPYGAHVHFELEHPAQGWAAPPTAPWLGEALEAASRDFYGHPPCGMGEGGSIPFMAMLGQRFPKAQFLITGVLGPHSNAHGPNEFLHIACAKQLSCAVAHVIAAMPG